jgi:hypothetical protein
MERRKEPWWVSGFKLVAMLAAGFILAHWLTAGTDNIVDSRPPAAVRPDVPSAPATLAEKHGCYDEAAPEGVIPGHALVEVDGKAKIVSFDAGWDMHLKKRPGILMAVCP